MTTIQRHEYAYPLILGCILAALVIGVRVVSGVGFGEGRSAEPFSPLGVFWNEEDNLQYIAWCRQAAEGRWLFADRFTLEPHDHVVFHPLFLLIGRIAAAIGATPLCVMVAGGVAVIPVITTAAYCCARFLGLSVSTARSAVLILSAGYGMSRLGGVIWSTATGSAGGPLPPWLVGADLFYYDALFFPTFFEYPFITICYAVLAVQCAVLARADAQAVVGATSSRWLIALVLLQLLLGLSHPYEHILIAAAYGLAIIGSFVVPGGSRETTRRRFPVLVALVVPSGLVVAYYLWLSQLPVWRDVARQSLAIPCPRTVWILGYGALLPLAVVGGWLVIRDLHRSRSLGPDDVENASDCGRCLWLVTWAALVLGLLIGLESSRSKVCAGGYLPLAMLGAIAMEPLRSRATSAGYTARTGLRFIVRLALWALLLQGAVWQVGVFARQCQRVRSEIFDVAARLAADAEGAGEARPKVLAEPRIARLLVALAGVRVYCGNVYKTPDFQVKQARLVDAGVVEPPGDAVEYQAMARSLDALLDDCDFDYAVTFGRNAIDQALVETRRFSPPQSYGRLNLYVARGGFAKPQNPGTQPR